MFQHVLVVLEQQYRDRTLQTTSLLSQFYGSKVSLLHLETAENAPLLLCSEARPKEWASVDSTFYNASPVATPTLIRPTSKLKVVGTEPSVFNQLQGNFGQVTQVFPQTRSLETAIGDVAQLCKANLVIVGLSQQRDIAYSDLSRAANCPILVLK